MDNTRNGFVPQILPEMAQPGHKVQAPKEGQSHEGRIWFRPAHARPCDVLAPGRFDRFAHCYVHDACSGQGSHPHHHDRYRRARPEDPRLQRSRPVLQHRPHRHAPPLEALRPPCDRRPDRFARRTVPDRRRLHAACRLGYRDGQHRHGLHRHHLDRRPEALLSDPSRHVDRKQPSGLLRRDDHHLDAGLLPRRREFRVCLESSPVRLECVCFARPRHRGLGFDVVRSCDQRRSALLQREHGHRRDLMTWRFPGGGTSFLPGGGGSSPPLPGIKAPSLLGATSQAPQPAGPTSFRVDPEVVRSLCPFLAPPLSSGGTWADSQIHAREISSTAQTLAECFEISFSYANSRRACIGLYRFQRPSQRFIFSSSRP